MNYDPVRPKSPPPPHTAPHPEAFYRAAPQGHQSSRVGTVQRHTDDSHIDLRFDANPRNIQFSEFLESIAPQSAERSQPDRGIDSTRPIFRTLGTFPFQPTNPSYPRWPDTPRFGYSLYPRSEEPFLHLPTHKTPSRIGTVTKRKDERIRSRLPPPQEDTRETEEDLYEDPVVTELLERPQCRLSLKCRRPAASEVIFRTREQCVAESSEEYRKCFNGTIRCRKSEDFPASCRPFSCGSGSRRGEPPSGYQERWGSRSPFWPQLGPQDAICPYGLDYKKTGIQDGIYNLTDFYQDFIDTTKEKDSLLSQSTSQETEKPVLFIPGPYQPRGASVRLRGEEPYFLSDERFPTQKSTPERPPSENATIPREASARYPSKVGTINQSRVRDRSKSPVKDTLNASRGSPRHSPTDPETSTSPKQPILKITPPTPHKTHDKSSPTPKFQEQRAKNQSKVGTIYRNVAMRPKPRPSSVPQSKGSGLAISRHHARMQDRRKKDPNTQDKREKVTRLEVPSDNTSGRAKTPERTVAIHEPIPRYPSRIGTINKRGRPSKLSVLPASPQSPSQNISGKPFYSGDKRAYMVSALVFGASSPKQEPGEKPKRSKVPRMEPPSPKRRPKQNTKPPTKSEKTPETKESSTKPLLWSLLPEDQPTKSGDASQPQCLNISERYMEPLVNTTAFPLEH